MKGAQKVPRSHLTPSGTLGGGISGRWTVPTASGRTGRATQDPRHGKRIKRTIQTSFSCLKTGPPGAFRFRCSERGRNILIARPKAENRDRFFSDSRLGTDADATVRPLRAETTWRSLDLAAAEGLYQARSQTANALKSSWYRTNVERAGALSCLDDDGLDGLVPPVAFPVHRLPVSRCLCKAEYHI